MSIKAVAVGGVFDGLHVGHVALLRYADALTDDPLIVLLNDQTSLVALGREAQHTDEQRQSLIWAIVPTAEVLFFTEPDPAVALMTLVKRDLTTASGLVLFIKGRDALNAPQPELGLPGVAYAYFDVVDGAEQTKLRTRRG
jgi:bifunctional ADP-heptose synthase (sugar kinase/adenylyltransferase)